MTAHPDLTPEQQASDITDEELAAIKARADAAPAGPWEADGSEVVVYQSRDWIAESCRTADPEHVGDRIATFIAHAREDVPALVAEVERLRAGAEQIGRYINNAEQNVCGEWCGDDWPDCDHGHHDAGRALLAELGIAETRPWTPSPVGVTGPDIEGDAFYVD